MEADRMTAFLHRQEGPRFRDDGRAQRVRERRELAGRRADEAHAERRLRLARYGRSTIGNKSDIENVRIKNLQNFYHTYYQPDNAVLLVAGKFDAAKTLLSINRLFGAIPKPKRTLPAFWTVEPTQDGERTFTVRRQGDVQIVALGYKVPSGLHDDSDVLSFASTILGDVPTGRLHKLLVETGKASQVFAFGQTGYAPGLQYFGASSRRASRSNPCAPP
jgi:zinc protease